MIKYSEFEKFSKENKRRVIEMIFGGNIKAELFKIENDILEKGEKSEYIQVLLENISLKHNNFFGRWYDVNSLIYISPEEIGYDPEEDREK